MVEGIGSSSVFWPQSRTPESFYDEDKQVCDLNYEGPKAKAPKKVTVVKANFGHREESSLAVGAKGALKGAVAGAFLPFTVFQACADVNTNIDPCSRNASIFDPDGVYNRGLEKTANERFSKGLPNFTATIDVPADGIMSTQEFVNDQLAVSIFTSNGTRLGANESSVYHSMGSSEADYSACNVSSAVPIQACSPFMINNQEITGLVPVGVAKTVKLPAEVVAGSAEAANYAVGGKMLAGVGDNGKDGDGRQLFAVWSQLQVPYTSKNPDGTDAVVSKPVYEYTYKLGDTTKTDLVVEIKAENCNSDDAGNPCTSEVHYYLVTSGGSVTTDEVAIDPADRTSLVNNPANIYYRVSPEGKYWSLDKNNVPVFDTSLAEKDFELVVDPGITMQDLYMGNSDKGIHGIAINSAGIYDPTIIPSFPLVATTNVVDLRNPAVEVKDPLATAQVVDQNGNIIDKGGSEIVEIGTKATAKRLDIPRALYDNGDAKFQLQIHASVAQNISNFASTVGGIMKPQFTYSDDKSLLLVLGAAFDARISFDNSETCSK